MVEPAEEGGFFAYCPEVPGGNGQGETNAACLQNLREAIELVLEDPRERGHRPLSADARWW